MACQPLDPIEQKEFIDLAFRLAIMQATMVRRSSMMVIETPEAKRALLAGAVVVVTATCLVILLAPRFWPVAAAGVVGGLAGTVIGPCLAAISLGIVGPARFAQRAGRNESLFHLGNGVINVIILVTAPVLGTAVVFCLMGLTAAASVARSGPRRRSSCAAARS